MLQFLRYFILFVVVVVALCVQTKPDREQHVTEISATVVEALAQGAPMGELLPESAMAIIKDKNVLQNLLDKTIVVEDYFVLSFGKLVTTDDEYPLSIGAFGKVFLLAGDGMTERAYYKLRELKIVD